MRRVNHTDTFMAHITAEQLVEHPRQSGLKPPGLALSAPESHGRKEDVMFVQAFRVFPSEV